jgi:predicted transcriptional regulator
MENAPRSKGKFTSLQRDMFAAIAKGLQAPDKGALVPHANAMAKLDKS